jgi:hypothetical protein
MWAGLAGQLFLADLAAPNIELVVTMRAAKCLVIVVGRKFQLGPAALIAAAMT